LRQSKRGGSPSFFLIPLPRGRGIKGDGVTDLYINLWRVRFNKNE